MTVTEDSYLNDYVQVSPRLAAVLDITRRGGAARRFRAADELAEQLGIDVERLAYHGYRVLSGMLVELEAILAAGPGSWADDPVEDRHGRIARAAVADLGLVEAAEALVELRLDRFRPSLSVASVDALTPALRQVIVDWLAPRVLRMLDQWRKRGAWDADVELGIVPMRWGA